MRPSSSASPRADREIALRDAERDVRTGGVAPFMDDAATLQDHTMRVFARPGDADDIAQTFRLAEKIVVEGAADVAVHL